MGESPPGSACSSTQTAEPALSEVERVPPLRYPGFPIQEIQIRSGRDDKFEGGGSPWHGWRWMDRVEKANLDKTG